MKNILSLLLLLFVSVSGAYAAEEEDIFGDLIFHTSITTLSESKIENSDSELQVNKIDLSLANKIFSFAYGQRDYNWDKNSAIEPFTDLHYLSLGLKYGKPISEKALLFAGIKVIAALEDDLSSDLNYTLFSGMNYQCNDNWKFTFGLLSSWHKVDDIFMPLVGFKFESDSYVDKGLGFKASVGIKNTSLSYHFTDKFSSTLHLVNDTNVYKLSNDNGVEKNGFAKIEDRGLGLKFNYAFNENIQSSLGFERLSSRKYRIYNSSGSKVSKTKIKDANAIKLSLNYKF